MSGKPLRVLGIEIDLSGKKAKDDLADWNREVREALGLSDEYVDGVDDMAKEMREYAKKIGLTKEQLRELQETSKKNREVGDFAKKYGLQADQIKRMGSEASAAEKQMSTLKGVMGGLAAIGIGAAVKSVGGELVDLSKKAERTRITFDVMLKSPKQAKETLNMLKEFADVSPFTDTEAIMAGKQLVNAKIPLDQLKQTLTDIGNVAAGAEVPFAELAEIYSKNKMSGIIQGEDVNQLAGRGIPIMEALAKVKGVQTDQIRALTASGAIQFKDLQQAFEIMSKDNYPGLMDRLSQSAEGLSSTFDSKFIGIKKTLGDVLLEGLKPLWAVGISFMDWLQNNKTAINIVKAGFLVLIPIIGTLLVAALWSAAAAAWGLIVPLLPIILIVALVGAAVLGLILIIEDLYIFFTGGDSVIGEWVNGIKSKFSGVLTVVKTWFSSAIGFFKEKGKYLIMAIFPISAIYFYWDQISAFLKSIPDKIVSFFKSIPDRILTMLSGLKDMLKGLLPDWAVNLLAKIKFSDNTEKIQARAAGGPVNSGSPYLVGEEGPELFTPSSSGRIIPNGALGGGRRSANITIAPVFNISGAADPESIASYVMKKIEDLIPSIEAELGLEVG